MKKITGLIGAVALAFTVGCAQTDAGITSSVKSKFAADDTVKAYQIDVDTMDHVVTLRGEVESNAARERAVQLATTTDGVRDVVDQLIVNDAAATSGNVDVDRDVDVDVSDDLKRGGEIVKEGAKETGTALKQGAEKVGAKVKDAVTDDNRDSDRDGR